MLSAFLVAASLASGPAEAPRVPRPTLEPDLKVVVRPEARINPSFGAAGTPNANWRVREGVRLGLTGRWGPLTAKAQAQDVRDFGGTGETASVRGFFGLHQGYLSVGGERGRVRGYLRAGRQEIRLWTDRVLADSPWNPAMRAFDAARGFLEVGPWHIQAAGLVIDFPHRFDVVDDSMPSQAPTQVKTWGQQIALVETGFLLHEALGFDVSSLVVSDGPEEGDLEQDRLFVMPGFHVHGEPAKGFEYAIEAWMQVGRDTERRHVAWAGVATASYTAPIPAKPGVGVTYELSSGEACTGDPELGEPCGATRSANFDPLFGVRHRFRGLADVTGWSNSRDLQLYGKFAPGGFATFRADYHWLQIHDAQGQWFGSGLTPIGSGWDPNGTSHTLGHEVDLTIDVRPWQFMRVVPGYSVFVPVAAGRRIGGPDPLHFTYLWLIVEF